MKFIVFLVLICLVLVSVFIFKTMRKSGSDDVANPEYLYKIVSVKEWHESSGQKYLITSPMDKDFIHLAKEDQVNGVAQKFWNNKDYFVLKVFSKKLIGRLVFEANPGGSNRYYHLYNGSIPLDAVVDVKEIHTTNK